MCRCWFRPLIGPQGGHPAPPSCRVQIKGVVVVTGDKPLRCKMGRENSAESLWMYSTPLV